MADTVSKKASKKKASKSSAKKAQIKKKAGGGKKGGKKTERKRDGKGLIVHFMTALIQAGHIEEIPEESRDQHKEAQRLRQFAEKLARQTRKFEGDDLPDGDDGDDDGEDGGSDE